MYKIFLVLTALVAVNGQGYGKKHHDIDYYAEPHYSFEYEVKDLHTKDIKSHKEQRKGDHTSGVYMLVEPDGSKRVIEYEVIGKKGGWLPKVHRDKDIHVDKKGHGKGESVQNYNLYQGKVQEVIVESHGHESGGYSSGGSHGGYSSGGSLGGYSSGGSLGGYGSEGSSLGGSLGGGSLGGYESEGSSLGGGSLGGYGESSLSGGSLGGYEESSLGGGYGSEGSSLGGSSLGGESSLGGYGSEGNSLGGYGHESSSGSSGYGHESSSGSSGYGHSSSSSGHYESSGYSHGGATSSVKYSTNGAKVTLSTNHVVPQKKYGGY